MYKILVNRLITMLQARFYCYSFTLFKHFNCKGDFFVYCQAVRLIFLELESKHAKHIPFLYY